MSPSNNINPVTLNHGAGGRVMRDFIRSSFLREFANPELLRLADAAVLDLPGNRIAFSTDSFVVRPVVFPGGDVGKLAVCGTVNDLAVMGAEPLYLSTAFVIEEGMDQDLLGTLISSAGRTARETGVQIVTGDTKVVRRGDCDQVYITTTGIGVFPVGNGLCAEPVAPGDAIIASGTLGDHAVAILAARHELEFATRLESDCAALNHLIRGVLTAVAGVKWMRDPTRGGAAAVLSELVEDQPFGALIQEDSIPVCDEVAAVCELLGFDPLHLANEGKVMLVVKADDAERVIATLHRHPLGKKARVIGRIDSENAGQVLMQTVSGGVRRLRRPAGELLPRIC